MEQNPSQIIKELVEKSPFSYAELEKKTGISKSALQRYASGNTKKIPIEAEEKIALALGVSASFIMGWEKAMPVVNKDDEQLIEMFDKLDEQGKDYILKFMRSLVESQEEN